MWVFNAFTDSWVCLCNLYEYRDGAQSSCQWFLLYPERHREGLWGDAQSLHLCRKSFDFIWLYVFVFKKTENSQLYLQLTILKMEYVFNVGECDFPVLDAGGSRERLTCPGVHAAQVFTPPQDFCSGPSYEESCVWTHQGLQRNHLGK